MLIVAVIVLLFLIAHGLGLLALVLGAAGGVLWYRHDVRRHPRVRCRLCTGSGDHKSALGGGNWFRRPFGDCRCCGGRKAHPRLAARLLDPEGYRKIKAEIERGRAKI